MSNICLNGSLRGSLSVGQGERGKSLEFTWEGTKLGIRVEGDIEYQFVDLGIEGIKGKEVQLQVSEGYIQWKYADEEEWKNLIALSELKGDRGLDGKSAYDLWIENGNEGTVEDFLNSLKGKDGEKGEQGEQGLPGANGVDGKDGITPNITIGTVTTLEPNEQATVENVGTLENPVFNFGIPKGQDGTGGGSDGSSIDDTTISTDKTWSSSKIEDFVLTNDGVVWTDVSGENLSIDYTKEGFLREIEIWGNTIQNEEDLSDIQHLGELYVDDEGEPILDELGREQYKVEIESCNKNLFNDIVIEEGSINSTGIEEPNVSRCRTEYIQTLPNTKISLSKKTNQWFGIYEYDKYNNFITMSLNVSAVKGSITTTAKTKYIRIRFNDNLTTVIANDYNLQLEQGDVTQFIPPQSNKTTILLPCQLMKVGDVKDRFYWDSEKGKYVVEKRVKNLVLNETSSSKYNLFSTIDGKNLYRILNLYNKNEHLSNMWGTVISNKFKLNKNAGNNITTYNLNEITMNGYDCSIYICSDIDNLEDFKNFINSNNFYILYNSNVSPQLIDTNITTPIKLPCYKDKTHIFVTGNIDGSIKAKAPLDGGQAILSLSQENKELQSVNQEQDELINISLLATDEMYMMLEPLLANTYNIGGNEKMVDLYVVMCMRGLKKIEDVPVRYREQVAEILNKLEE